MDEILAHEDPPIEKFPSFAQKLRKPLYYVKEVWEVDLGHLLSTSMWKFRYEFDGLHFDQKKLGQKIGSRIIQHDEVSTGQYSTCFLWFIVPTYPFSGHTVNEILLVCLTAEEAWRATVTSVVFVVSITYTKHKAVNVNTTVKQNRAK